MTLDTSKNLGGIGAILIFIGALASLGIQYVGILSLIGVILVLVALHGVGDIFGDKSIFKNALIGFITGIVGGIISVGIAVAAFFANLSNIKEFITLLYPSWNGDLSSLAGLSGIPPNTSNLNPSEVISLLAGILAVIVVVLVVMWIFAIIATFFIRRSLKQVSAKSSVGLFSTAGLLLLIGAVLLVVGIGAILMWIAALLLAIAFFQLKQPAPAATVDSSPPPPTTV